MCIHVRSSGHWPASPKAPAGEPARQDGVDLARRYEELRRRVLCGEIDGHRLGLSVLLRQGVTAWMRAACSIPTAPAPASPACPDGDTEPMVAVLVSMALACHRV